MNRVTLIINAIVLLNLLPNAAYLQAMRTGKMSRSNLISQHGEYYYYLQNSFKLKSQEAEKHNQRTLLIALPSDVLNQILYYCRAHDDNPRKSLEKSIKTFMRLSIVSKAFHHFLTNQTIGNFCASYSPQTKLNVFRKLMIPSYNPSDTIKHLPATITLCSGIDVATVENELRYLLIEAVTSNDIEQVALLLKHNANPHLQKDFAPIFFYAKTLETAQIFIKANVDIHMISTWPKTNVLWEVVKTKYPSDLLKLYLAHGVNAKTIHPYDNSCLLHKLMWVNLHIDDNFLKKVKLLLNAIPEMINTLNRKEKTPLDLAYNALKIYKKNNIFSEKLETIIGLLKQHGGKTAQEINH